MTAAIPNLVEVTDNDYLRGWKDAERVAEREYADLMESNRIKIHTLLDILDGRISVTESEMEIIRRWAE